MNNLSNVKQEYNAILYSYDKLIGLKGLIYAWNANCRTKEEIADYLNVTISFLNDAIECYKNKYGLSTQIDIYTIYFNPNFIITKLVEFPK